MILGDIRFADIEPALRDASVVRWLRPVLTGEASAAAQCREHALSASLALGHDPLAAINHAMTLCPSSTVQ